jgi:hypothetical protein
MRRLYILLAAALIAATLFALGVARLVGRVISPSSTRRWPLAPPQLFPARVMPLRSILPRRRHTATVRAWLPGIPTFIGATAREPAG